MEEHVSLHESRVEISMKKKKSEVVQSCPTLCDPMDTRLLHPWDFLGKSTGVGCRLLLQGTSQPRDRTQVSHIVERRFLSEPPLDLSQKAKKRYLHSKGSLTLSIPAAMGSQKTK